MGEQTAEYRELQIAFRELHSNPRFGGIVLELCKSSYLAKSAGAVQQRLFIPSAINATVNGPSAFNQLATDAGKHIPTSMRRQLPDLPTDPFTIWCEVLLACRPAELPALPPPLGKGELVSKAPFLDSAEAIELCGLLTDNPTLPTPCGQLNDEVNLQSDRQVVSDGEIDGPLTDLISLDDAAFLVDTVKKTIQNKISSARQGSDCGEHPPTAAIPGVGNRPDQYSYAQLRPWLLVTWPAKADRLPGDFAAIKTLLAARV
ncbi:MAG: hypothetical protein WD851_10195 [Pirellulales bacterium]